jgi:ABC-2 type transport system ATP-binding protein
MDAILKVDGLRVHYRAPSEPNGIKVAVDGLSFHVQRGEVFGFLGPNGAGKTTTMNVLLGYVTATGGRAELFGVDVRQPIARQRLGYLPELTYYYRFLTAEELLRFYAQVFGLSRSETDGRIERLLKLVELEAVRKRSIRTYS